MKKIYIIAGFLVLFVIAGYLYLRFGVLKTKSFTPDSSKATSVLDLRPAIIAKLQQLVKDGSKGLYKLSIDKLEPDISLSTLYVEKATLIPDSTILAKLENAHAAPDDVFKISFNSLHVTGIGIPDLLDKNNIDLKAIHLINPVIEVYHTKRAYNKTEREKNDSLTLYMRLMKGMKKINIDTLLVENATFINHNISKKSKVTRIDHISIKMADILIDSSTQYDRNRFLFAKSADISLKDYLLPTADSLYYFKVSSIGLSAVRHTLTALGADLVPRGNRKQFEKKLLYSNDMFTIKTQKITLNQFNWYDMLNEEKLFINDGTIEGCDFSDYYDKSLPELNSTLPSDFPNQLLMKMHVPIYIKKINLQHANVKYEEFHPAVQQSGTIYFNDINGQLSNITNIPGYIRNNSKMRLSARALFMQKANLNVDFLLDLKNYKAGHFSVDVTLGKIDGTLINPVSVPLGLISIKKGMVNKVIAHVDGNNYRGTGKLLLLYDDLHIDPLKQNDEGKLKRKGITSFLANFLLIKNANPSKGKNPRTAECNFKNDPDGPFFYLTWKTIMTGILKTIGLPEKIAYE